MLRGRPDRVRHGRSTDLDALAYERDAERLARLEALRHQNAVALLEHREGERHPGEEHDLEREQPKPLALDSHGPSPRTTIAMTSNSTSPTSAATGPMAFIERRASVRLISLPTTCSARSRSRSGTSTG